MFPMVGAGFGGGTRWRAVQRDWRSRGVCPATGYGDFDMFEGEKTFDMWNRQHMPGALMILH